MVEMRDRSPDVLDVLATISKQPSESQVPPVCFGYAVLMYQRNSKLGMLQKLLSILLGSGGCSRRHKMNIPHHKQPEMQVPQDMFQKVLKLMQRGN
ncbi:uncharacterized protein LOC144641722 isoform X2 [Oculina patagonica]